MKAHSPRNKSILKSALVFIVILLFVSTVQAQPLPQPQLLVRERLFNFGTVAEGTVVKHNFSIANTGDKELKIDRVLSSCGCTVGASSSDIIAPGGSAQISIEFNTAGFDGYKYKSIRIYTNAPEHSVAVFQLEGRVESELIVEPKQVVFKSLNLVEVPNVTQKVEIKVRDSSSGLKIKSVRSLSRRLIIQDLQGDALHKQLSIGLKPGLTIGEFRDRVLVKLEGGNSQVVNIPVLVEVVGDIKLSPAVLSFGLVEGSQKIHRKVIAENRSNKPIKLLGVSSEFEGLHVSYKPWNNGREFVLDLELDPLKLKNEQLKTQVILQFDTPEYAAVALNVYGVKPPSLQ